MALYCRRQLCVRVFGDGDHGFPVTELFEVGAARDLMREVVPRAGGEGILSDRLLTIIQSVGYCARGAPLFSSSKASVSRGFRRVLRRSGRIELGITWLNRFLDFDNWSE